MSNDGQADLLTSAEAATELGRSQATIARMAKRGELKPETKLAGIRGAYLFRRADVEALKTSSVPA